MTAGTSRGNIPRCLVLALGTAQTLGWGTTYYLPAILATDMAQDLGASAGMIFAAFSVALIVSAVLGPPAGTLIDRHGGRGLLTASSLVFAAGLALLGLANGPVLLFTAWIIIGVGMAIGLYEAAFATLAGLYGSDARGGITGITLLAGFASTICWPVSTYLNIEFGWRMTCWIWAAAHLVLGLPLNRLFLPRGDVVKRATKAVAVTSATAASKPMLLLAFVFAVTWFTSTAMAAHLPRLMESTGASVATAVLAGALIGPAQVAARILEYGVLSRFHPLLSARLAALAHPLGALILIAIGAPAAYLFAVLHGAGNGILTIAKGTLPLAIFGPAGYGQRQGFLMAPARIGQAMAPFLFALLIDRFGDMSLVFSAALGGLAACALLALSPVKSSDAIES